MAAPTMSPVPEPTEPAEPLEPLEPAEPADAARVEADPALVRACHQGDREACLGAARSVRPTGAFRVTLSTEEADRRERETAQLAGRACELGLGDGCLLQAHHGPWSERGAPLERGCALDHIGCCAHLGRALYSGGDGPDDRRGLALIERACRAGYHDAIYGPGELCDYMVLFVSDAQPQRAAIFRRLACAQGYLIGCPCERDEDCGRPEAFCDDTQREPVCEMMSAD